MKFVYAGTALLEEDIKRLKQKSKKITVKDALYEAVKHYLECCD